MCENCEKRSHVGCMDASSCWPLSNFQLLKVRESQVTKSPQARLNVQDYQQDLQKLYLSSAKAPRLGGLWRCEKIEAPGNH